MDNYAEHRCDICSKPLPTARGLAIHRSRLHSDRKVLKALPTSKELDRFEEQHPVKEEPALEPTHHYQPVGGALWCVVTTADDILLDVVGPFTSSVAADKWVLQHESYFDAITDDFLKRWSRSAPSGKFSPTVMQQFMPLQQPIGVDDTTTAVRSENARLREALADMAKRAIDVL